MTKNFAQATCRITSVPNLWNGAGKVNGPDMLVLRPPENKRWRGDPKSQVEAYGPWENKPVMGLNDGGRKGYRSAPVLAAPYTHLRFVLDSTNPKGIPARSPGLRGTSYPGYARASVINPERVASDRRIRMGQTWPQPFQGWRPKPTQAQGSSQARNPGLEDTIPLGLEMRVRCSVLRRSNVGTRAGPS